MKYLIIFGSVTVTGPPFSICFLNRGITEPLEPNTFPNLTAHNFVVELFLYPWTMSSHILFVAPITFVGFTALSVDINTKFSTLFFIQESITFFVPKTLFFIASNGESSIKGTCLCAAA